jgi:Carboxypeptidase regulatory-like domain
MTTKRKKKRTGSPLSTQPCDVPAEGCGCGRALRRTAAALCLLLVCCLPSSLAAKKKKPLTKTIQGQVLDSASQPIAGAAVELTDLTTKKTLGIYADADGHYEFTDLNPHDDYQVKATYKNQESEVRHASSLDDTYVLVFNLTVPAPSGQ